MFWTKYSSMLLTKSSLVKVSATRSRISGSEIISGNIRGTWGKTPAKKSRFICQQIHVFMQKTTFYMSTNLDLYVNKSTFFKSTNSCKKPRFYVNKSKILGWQPLPILLLSTHIWLYHSLAQTILKNIIIRLFNTFGYRPFQKIKVFYQLQPSLLRIYLISAFIITFDKA